MNKHMLLRLACALCLLYGSLSAQPNFNNDLTIGWITRLPAQDYVWNSSNPAVDGWPTNGQAVTWRAMVKNWSVTNLTNVHYQWYIDDVPVAAGTVSLPPGIYQPIDLPWNWTFDRHRIKLVIDDANTVVETEEGNNSLSIYSDAISLGLYVEQSVYDYFKQNQHNLPGVHSNCWEDWAQRMVRYWNDSLFTKAVFPLTPNGVLDRIRLDKVTVVPDGALPLAGGLPTNNPNNNDQSVDLIWGFPATYITEGVYADQTSVSYENPFYYEKTVIHELGHARYLIDVYGFNVHDDGLGATVKIEENGQKIVNTPYMPFVAADALYYNPHQGLMGGGSYLEPDDYSAYALNLIKGRRAILGNYNAPGNIGAYVNDLPLQNRVVVKDMQGNILAGAEVKVYQSTQPPTYIFVYGKYYDNTPDLQFTTDANGAVLMGKCPFSADGTVVHNPGFVNGTMILRVAWQGKVGYTFLESSLFNMEYWRGHTALGNYEVRVNPLGSSNNADLSLQMSASNPNPGIYQNTTFTLTLKNDGPLAASNVRVAVPISTGLAYSSSSTSAGSYNLYYHLWDVGNLAAGATVTMQLTLFTLNNNAITQYAQVQSTPTPDPDSSPGNGTCCTAVEDDEAAFTINGGGGNPKADLELTLSSSPSFIGSGTLTQIITVTNKGPATATGVTVKYTPPPAYYQAGSTYTLSQGTFSYANGIWNIGSIPANATVTLNAGVYFVDFDYAPPSFAFAQVQTAQPQDPDSTPGNDTNQTANEDDEAGAVVYSYYTADISLQKSVSQSNVNTGDQITYTLTATSNGPGSPPFVKVNDLLPAGLQFISYSASAGTYDPISGDWDMNGLNANQTKTLQIVVKVTGQNQTIRNFAQVSAMFGYDPDSTPGNDTDQSVNEDDEAAVSITVGGTPKADLELTLSSSPSIIGSGMLTQIITVTNKGPATATGVTVQYSPPPIYIVSGSSYTLTQGSFSFASGLWNIGSIPPNTSVSLNASLFIIDNEYTPPSFAFAQVQTAQPQDPDSTPGNDTNQTTNEDDEASAVVYSLYFADISLQKSVSQSNVNTGDQITYTLTATNNGPGSPPFVKVNDLLPAGLQFLSYSASAGAYDPLSGDWDMSGLNANQTKTLQIVVKVTGQNQTIRNFAQVSAMFGYDPDSTPGNDTDQSVNEDDEAAVSITVGGSGGGNKIDLELGLSANATQLNIYSNIAFTYTIINKGAVSANGVVVTAPIPAGLVYSSANATVGSYNLYYHTWNVGNLGVNQSATLTLSLFVLNESSPITLYTQVSAASPQDVDSAPGNCPGACVPHEDDEAALTIAAHGGGGGNKADLELTMSSNPNIIGSGIVTQIITVTNKGPANATGVTVQYTHPDHFWELSSSFVASQGSFSYSTGTWNIGNLPANATVTLQLNVFFIDFDMGPPAYAFAQIQTAQPQDPDSTPGNDSNQTANEDDEASVFTYSQTTADLSLQISASPTNVSTGGQVTYTLTLTNNGPGSPYDVIVTDLLPAGVQFVSYTTSSGTYVPSTGLWDLVGIASGQSQTLQILVNVTGQNQTIRNYAQVSTSIGYDPDSTPGNDTNQTVDEDDEAAVSINVGSGGNGRTDLQLSLSTASPTYQIYNNIIYTATIANTSSVNATNVSVSFPLPTGLVFSASTASKGSYNLYSQTWNIGALAANESATLQLSLFPLVGSQPITAFAQVKTASPQDSDSSPGNNTTQTPTEDDEAAVTVTPGTGGHLQSAEQQHRPLVIRNIYPVPTDSWVFLDLNVLEDMEVKLSLTDVRGAVVLVQNLSLVSGQNEVTLDISSLPSGIYIVQIAGNNLKGMPMRVVKI